MKLRNQLPSVELLRGMWQARPWRQTGLNVICGDLSGLPWWARRTYHLLNRISNGLPEDAGLRLGRYEERPYRALHLERDWARVRRLSPARCLSELFWAGLPWDEMRAELGALHVVDSGCGPGNYLGILQDLSGMTFDSYLGIDVSAREEWKKRERADGSIRFVEDIAERVGVYLDGSQNVFVTQSAIEHFPQDRVYFRALAAYCRDRRSPTVQVHLFPAASCLELYGLHGFRHYTPRTVRRIVSLFDDFSESRLVGLGGPNGYRLHQDAINGRRYRQDEPAYQEALKEAVLKDRGAGLDQALFYGLVIRSHPRGTDWLERVH